MYSKKKIFSSQHNDFTIDNEADILPAHILSAERKKKITYFFSINIFICTVLKEIRK